MLIAMQRERQRNAVDRHLTEDLSAHLDGFEDDPELRVAVLTGTRTVFSAGTDLHEPASPVTASGGEYGLVRRARGKPLLAAVEGAAYGGGFEIALACDIVVAARTAHFALPEVRRGVVASCGGLFRTTRAVPVGVANLLLLTGDPISAQEAFGYGLVTRLSEPGEAVTDALSLAQRIARNSPTAVRETLAGIRNAQAELDAAGWRATAASVSANAASLDASEGISAFFEKREARWLGR